MNRLSVTFAEKVFNIITSLFGPIIIKLTKRVVMRAVVKSNLIHPVVYIMKSNK